MLKGTIRHVIILEQKVYLTKKKCPVKYNYLRMSCHGEMDKKQIENKELESKTDNYFTSKNYK